MPGKDIFIGYRKTIDNGRWWRGGSECQSFHKRKDVFAKVLDNRSEGIFIGVLVEIERTAQEMAGGIGNEKLGGRGRVAFDEVDQPENIVPAEKFYIDRLCLDGVGIGQLVAILYITLQGSVRRDCFIRKVYFGVIGRIYQVNPIGLCIFIAVDFYGSVYRFFKPIGKITTGKLVRFWGKINPVVPIGFGGVFFVASYCGQQEERYR